MIAPVALDSPSLKVSSSRGVSMTRIPAQLTAAFLVILLPACAANTGRVGNGSSTTVGVVQKEIKVGMSGAEVASALGSPNVVTTDEKRREVWIYDKISTESVSTKGGGALGGAFGSLLLGVSASGESRSTTQKTLTVIIKFDEQGVVRDYAYHSSKF